MLRVILITFWLSSSFFASSFLFAGTRDPHTPDADYLEFGKKFSSVVRFRAATTFKIETGETVSGFQYGSAAIIRPNWALTAAHLITDLNDHAVIADDGTVYPISATLVPTEFEGDTIGFYDLALCYSPKDFGLKFYTPLYKERDEAGKAITIAGYGITGTFNTGCVLSDKQKRAGHNRIDRIERAVLVCSPSRGAKRMPLEFMISPGDSGGGMYIGNELAGINSFLMAVDGHPNGTYTDESAFTRISLYVDWIESQIEQYERALGARATMNSDLNFVVSPLDLMVEDSTAE